MADRIRDRVIELELFRHSWFAHWERSQKFFADYCEQMNGKAARKAR